MKTLSIATTLILISSYACSNSELNSDTKTEDISSQQTTESDQAIPSNIVSTPVNEPIMTGGGFLVCQAEISNPQPEDTEANVDCMLTDSSGNGLLIEDEDTVQFSKINADGVESSLDILNSESLEGVTHWFFSIVLDKPAITIIASLPDGQVLRTDILTETIAPELTENPNPIDLQPATETGTTEISFGPELIVNGSFANPAITNPQFSEGGRSWSHMSPNQVSGWSAVWNNTSCQNEVRIEIQRLNISGEQWIDLAGSCQFGVVPPPSGSNLKITQSVSTVAGYNYQLIFRFRQQDQTTNALQVIGPEGSLYDTSLLNEVGNGWQTITLEFKAIAEVTELSFLEFGTDPLQGTLLDDISLKEIRTKLIE